MVLQEVEAAIASFFSDQNRSAGETLCDLIDLRDDLEVRIDALENQIEKEKYGG